MTTTVKSATLHDLLTEQVTRRSDLGDRLTGTVLLDTGRGGVWTLRLDHGSITLHEGVAGDWDTHVVTDPETFAGVLSGEESGIQAFLRGGLRVRGNLALSLKLD